MPMTKDKWKHYQIMKKDKKLFIALPKTRLMGKRNVRVLLNQYGGIFLKPRKGQNGYGVIQISTKPKHRYEFHFENKRTTLQRKKQIYSFKSFRNYIVQQRIPLVKIDGHPFDIRVIVQRKPKSPWTITGMFAKVAAKGYVITNVPKEIMKVEEAIHRCILKPHRMKVLNKISAISLRVAKQLNHAEPGQRIVGLDVGLDNRGKVWIIEANSRPEIAPFLLFIDKTMYRKIMYYKRGSRKH